MASGGKRVEQQRARQFRRAVVRGAQRLGLKELSSGASAWPCHSRATSLATTAPVRASVPGVGLISRSSAKPLCCTKAATAFSVGSGSPA